MLTISRRVGDKVVGHRVILGIEAPNAVPVVRAELLDRPGRRHGEVAK